ncbi:hypothetical protein [Microcystis phage vB_MweS-yong2]|nr:hypothetical protein [Microcystis phage vB_MweS-yong2]
MAGAAIGRAEGGLMTRPPPDIEPRDGESILADIAAEQAAEDLRPRRLRRIKIAMAVVLITCWIIAGPVQMVWGWLR